MEEAKKSSALAREKETIYSVGLPVNLAEPVLTRSFFSSLQCSLTDNALHIPPFGAQLPGHQHPTKSAAISFLMVELWLCLKM